MIPNREIRKSRHLTVHQLFEVLQQEFIVCELRSKIYPVVFHQGYWAEMAAKKKEKILNIAKRNGLFSIFDSEKIKKDFYEKIIPAIGFPNFIYKDDLQRLKMEKWDLHNYYLPNTDVQVYIDNELCIGVIDYVNLAQNTAKIRINNEIKICDVALVTRIL